jgi:DNA repair exonuclease SbcCD ATPase subunit
MRPLRLELENVARFPSAEITFAPGTTSLTGPNGSGKSTALKCLEVSLFGEGSRDLAPMLGVFGERCEIELDFEHGAYRYRIRRGYRGGARGVATMDLERWVEE